MKFRFAKLGTGGEAKRELKITYAKNMKVLWIALWFFGLQMSFGPNPVDIIALRKVIADQLNASAGMAVKDEQPYFNRHQRRAMMAQARRKHA